MYLSTCVKLKINKMQVIKHAKKGETKICIMLNLQVYTDYTMYLYPQLQCYIHWDSTGHRSQPQAKSTNHYYSNDIASIMLRNKSLFRLPKVGRHAGHVMMCIFMHVAKNIKISVMCSHEGLGMVKKLERN